MARILRQSTSVDVPIGPFLDDTDGKTAETALTITQPDIRLKKNGGAWAQKNAAQTLTHEENGNYEVTLDATDTNTLGLLRLHVNESGAIPVWEDFLVVPANVFDSFFSTDLLQVDLAQWLGLVPNALTSGSVPSFVNVINTDAIQFGTIAADTGLAPIRAGTCAGGTSNSITLNVGSSSTTDFYKGTRIYLTSGTGAGQSRLCTAYNGTTRVATVEPDWIITPVNASTIFVIRAENSTPAVATGGIAASSFAAGAINAAATNADFLAEINAEVDTALADYDAPTFAELDARTDAIEADTQDIQSRLPAALVSGRIKALVEAVVANAIDNAALADDTDSYAAKCWVVKEGLATDHYGVTFYKNGQPIETGITSPLLDYVKKLSDGSVLVNDATLIDRGNGDYYYGEGTNKLSGGQIYMSRITATIDGSTRIMKQQVGRDSA